MPLRELCVREIVCVCVCVCVEQEWATLLAPRATLQTSQVSEGQYNYFKVGINTKTLKEI